MIQTDLQPIALGFPLHHDISKCQVDQGEQGSLGRLGLVKLLENDTFVSQG